MRVVLDIETNKLRNPDKIWCIVAKNISTGQVYEWTGNRIRNFVAFSKRIDQAVGHNIIDFDAPVLRRLLGIEFPDNALYDTLVVSRLINYRLEGGHSLENWGKELKHPKVGLDITDWSTYSPEMLERCHNDVELNHKLYNHLNHRNRIANKGAFNEAIKCEMAIAGVCHDMHSNGFKFNKAAADQLCTDLEGRIGAIDGELEKAFPPIIKIKELKTKTKTISVPFNPASPKQIVERLKGFWKPKEKTEKGQAKINEANLATLREDAPVACKRLVERLLLTGRQRALRQWIDAYDEVSQRVHPRFIGIGTWTHRMAHREPNLGNIAAPKSIKYKGRELADLATSLGSRMRGLWTATPGESWLVGCDAEGIQLRVFAHYIDEEEFTNAVVSGKKEEGTDPHSLNAGKLGCERDPAKTFIFAFLLGAGDSKLAEILGRNKRAGAELREQFIKAYPGLERLKLQDIPRDAKNRGFRGFDGRLIACDSEHLMMAGYLQTGEACIMKHANLLWRKELDGLGIRYKQVNFVHDEYQTEVIGSRAEAQEVGAIQARSIRLVGEHFGLRCPMAGSYRVGQNWLETH